jgi:hypothetical protein
VYIHMYYMYICTIMYIIVHKHVVTQPQTTVYMCTDMIYTYVYTYVYVHIVT